MSGRSNLSPRRNIAYTYAPPSPTDTRDADSVVSNLSNLSSLDTDDEFGKLLIQRARDERRMREATRGNTELRAFRKARVHPHVGRTMEKLERREREREMERDHDRDLSPSPRRPDQARWESPESVNSEGSRMSDPPVQPPREWGRKGKRRVDWLRNVMETSGSASYAGEEAPLPEYRDERSADVDWAGTADEPLPSVESGFSLPHASPAKHGTPVSSRRYDGSPNKLREWELEEDFTMGSVIASTPAVPRRNSLLDDIRAEEIESFRERGLSYSRLEAIQENTPDTARPRTSYPPLLPLNEQTNEAHRPPSPSSPTEMRPKSRAGIVQSKGKAPMKLTSSAGDRVPGSPVVAQNATQDQKFPQRPSAQREDSHDILRRLARVTSSSPSPSRGGRSTPPPKHSSPLSQSDEANNDGMPSIENKKEGTKKPLPLDTKPNHLGKNIAEGLKGEISTPRPGTREPASTEPSNGQPEQASRESEKQTQLPAPLKTPKVMGAWVDTPAGFRTTERPQSPRRQSPTKKTTSVSHGGATSQDPGTSEAPNRADQHREAAKPDVQLPSSALDAIISQARSYSQEGGSGHDENGDTLGDSTIDSLEDLLGITKDELTQHPDLDEDTLLGLQQVLKGKPRTESERMRQKEVLALCNMNARLRATRTSIRDADRGLKRVENALEVIDKGEIPPRIYPHAHSGGACPQCSLANGHLFSPWRMMWDRFTSLYCHRNAEGHLRPTTFGWICLIFWTWFILEMSLSNFYCQPRFASRMEGYGVYKDAPEMPWVTITVLFKPFKFLWGPVLSPIFSLFRPYYTSWKAYLARVAHESNPDLYHFVVPSAARTVKRVSTSVYGRATATATAGAFSDESIMQDELI